MSRVEYRTARVSPDAYTTTAAYTVVTGSEMTMLAYTCLAYTILVATHDIKWKVMGANTSDYSDEVEVQAEATVTAGNASSYAVSVAPYAYYRIKVVDASGGDHGEVTVVGIAKVA